MSIPTTRKPIVSEPMVSEAHLASFDRTMQLMALLETEAQSLREHAYRVTDLATSLAVALRPDDADLAVKVAVGALLHDVGKTTIPTHILNKTSRLEPSEMMVIRCHAAVGATLLQPLIDDKGVLEIVRNHHEHWDGSGYPDKLAGNAISLGARIVSVADAFDAMTSDRPYHRGISSEAALKLLYASSGKAWDPEVVEAISSLYESGRWPRTMV